MEWRARGNVRFELSWLRSCPVRWRRLRVAAAADRAQAVDSVCTPCTWLHAHGMMGCTPGVAGGGLRKRSLQARGGEDRCVAATLLRREGEVPSAQRPQWSLPRLHAAQPEADGNPKFCFLLADDYLLIFSAVCLAKLCSNILIIIWSWLAYMHTVSLKHMGTFQRLILKRCYSATSHKACGINWYFSLPLLSFSLLLRIFCTFSGRRVGGQIKKEMKYSLARKGYKDKWYHSKVKQLWACSIVRTEMHVDELCHLTCLQCCFIFRFFCCGANDNDDIKPFHLENPTA